MDDRLQKAPLIEAIFEFRWQPAVADRNGDFPSRVHSYDLSAFPFVLSRNLQDKGYTTVEHIVPEFAPPTPHEVRTRYRRTVDPWPCVQVGDGIVTVNQINDGYQWETFRRDLLSALSIVFGSRDVEFPFSDPLLALRYIDGIPTDSFREFLADDTNIEVQIGKSVTDTVAEPIMMGCESVSFAGKLAEPEGASVELSVRPHPNINGQPGVHLTYLVYGKPGVNDGMFLIDSVEEWIEPAHLALRSLFRNTFTAEAYERFR